MDDRVITATLVELGRWEPVPAAAGAWAGVERRVTHRRRRRRSLVLGAAAAVVAVLAAGVWVSNGGDTAEVVTSPTPPPVQDVGFAALGPGWHRLDTGPVPVGARPVWTDAGLLALGGTPLSAHLYDPATEVWRAVAVPPFDGAVAAAGDRVVVVAEDGSRRSAIWDPGGGSGGEWTDLGVVPVAPQLAATGSQGARSDTGGTALVWTGQRVLDLSQGAVLDPDTAAAGGGWEPLALPDDVVAYTGLVSSNPVFDGTEVVLVGSLGPGLAWDATGTTYRVLPAAPDDTGIRSAGPASRDPATVAVRDGDRVVLIASNASTAAVDARTGTWTRLAGAPDVRAARDCVTATATVNRRAAVQPCDDGPPAILMGGRWEPDPAGPSPVPNARWTTTGRSVIAWHTDTDTLNNPDAPYLDAWIWNPTG